MKQAEVENSIKRKAALVYAGTVIKHMCGHGKDELMCICVAECVCVHVCVSVGVCVRVCTQDGVGKKTAPICGFKTLHISYLVQDSPTA